MKRRAEAIRADPRVLPKSTLGKAVRYLLNEYTALVGYLRDGRFEIDSNLVENDVRPSAVGKSAGSSSGIRMPVGAAPSFTPSSKAAAATASILRNISPMFSSACPR